MILFLQTQDLPTSSFLGLGILPHPLLPVLADPEPLLTPLAQLGLPSVAPQAPSHPITKPTPHIYTRLLAQIPPSAKTLAEALSCFPLQGKGSEGPIHSSCE